MGTERPEQEPEYEAPFAALLDMRPGLCADGVGSATMTIHDTFLQDAGVVQGGLIVSLADYAFYRAADSVLRPGQRTVTVELKVNFIAAVKDGVLTATAHVLSAGRRVIVAEMKVTDQQQKVIAHGLGTCLVVQEPP
ncbi:MAG: PaaI family thioesterase [Dehalococcoidia bacterium]|nr:PaaI family thioesterase [Dehalococcoidia bacterium]